MSGHIRILGECTIRRLVYEKGMVLCGIAFHVARKWDRAHKRSVENVGRIVVHVSRS